MSEPKDTVEVEGARLVVYDMDGDMLIVDVRRDNVKDDLVGLDFKTGTNGQWVCLNPEVAQQLLEELAELLRKT